MLRFVLIGLIVFGGCTTFAHPQFGGHIEAHYRRSAVELLKRAQESGITEIGIRNRTSIDQLLHDIAGIHFKILERFSKPEGALRHTAFYSPSTRTIFFNAAAPVDESFLGVLALHEIFGALGYNDTDYRVSLGLYLYSNHVLGPERIEIPLMIDGRQFCYDAYGIVGPCQLSRDFKILPPNQDEVLSINAVVNKLDIDIAFDRPFIVIPSPDSFLNFGGVNFVGGAGDIRGLFYKQALLNTLNDLPMDVTLKKYYARVLFKMDLEINADSNVCETLLFSKATTNSSWIQLVAIIPQSNLSDRQKTTADLKSIMAFINVNFIRICELCNE